MMRSTVRTVHRDALLQAEDLVGLGAFRTLDDVELYLIAFFEALIAVPLDGAVVNEDVWSSISPEKAVSLCVIEPLYDAFILCHLIQLPLVNRSVIRRICGLTPGLCKEFSE